jgi:hypothetical protein
MARATSSLPVPLSRNVGVRDASDEVAHLAHLLARAKQLADSRRVATMRGPGRRGFGELHTVQLSKANATGANVSRCCVKALPRDVDDETEPDIGRE